MEPDRFNGDFTKSALKFQQHDIDNFQLMVDAQPIVTHPLKMHNNNSMDFFANYLHTTNRYNNAFCESSMSYANFNSGNFLVYTNLHDDGYTHGQLTLKLKFKQAKF